jgi:hypothetical protein
MMIKYIKQGLALSTITDKKIRTNDVDELESLKERLMDRFVSPIGWHTSGIPIILSFVCALISFALMQAPIWIALFRWTGLPEQTVFIGIFPTLALFCVLAVTAMMAISRGFLFGLKLFLMLIALTAVGSVTIFIVSVISSVSAAEGSLGRLVGAAIGLIFIIFSIQFLNSQIFVRSIAYALHNRVWRKQLKTQPDTR